MLGIRLDDETERGLARAARRTGRTKSDIARDAIREFLGRVEMDAELERELALIAATSDHDLDAVDALADDMLRLIDAEERGGPGA